MEKIRKTEIYTKENSFIRVKRKSEERELETCPQEIYEYRNISIFSKEKISRL